MKRMRRALSPAFKGNVAIEALKNDRTISELSSVEGHHIPQGGSKRFDTGAGESGADSRKRHLPERLCMEVMNATGSRHASEFVP